MLLPKRLHDGIEDGSVTVAFRRWHRPTVRAGGTLRWARGVLAIDAVTPVEESRITDADARLAGEADHTAVLALLDAHERARDAARVRRRGTADGPPSDDSPARLYRIEFHHAGDDPRIGLAGDEALDDAEVARLRARLARKDRASPRGPWTRMLLHTIRDHPEVAARHLAEGVGLERDLLKRNVRQLKELGLTISCPVGYRLSPRGEAYLAATEPGAHRRDG